MECPFELPVRKIVKASKSLWVYSKDGFIVCKSFGHQRTDYIVQAINSHEKLVKALQYLVADHPAGLLPDKPKSLLKAAEALESEKK